MEKLELALMLYRMQMEWLKELQVRIPHETQKEKQERSDRLSHWDDPE